MLKWIFFFLKKNKNKQATVLNLNVKCLSLDVNIWLVTFGFHLHNAIPGFPIPKFDLTQPSLEMRKSQLWDDLPVRIPRPNLLPSQFLFVLGSQMSENPILHSALEFTTGQPSVN